MYNIALPKNQEFLDFDMYPCSKKEVIVPYVCLPACLRPRVDIPGLSSI